MQWANLSICWWYFPFIFVINCAQFSLGKWHWRTKKKDLMSRLGLHFDTKFEVVILFMEKDNKTLPYNFLGLTCLCWSMLVRNWKVLSSPSLGLLSPPYPLFQCCPQSKEFLLNLSMKCWNSAFNAQGSRVIIVVVQVTAMNIYVAAVEALRKKERQDETQFRAVRPITQHLVSQRSANFWRVILWISCAKRNCSPTICAPTESWIVEKDE